MRENHAVIAPPRGEIMQSRSAPEKAVTLGAHVPERRRRRRRLLLLLPPSAAVEMIELATGFALTPAARIITAHQVANATTGMKRWFHRRRA